MRGQFQSAYQIIVASNLNQLVADRLNALGYFVDDSGVRPVESDDVNFEDKALAEIACKSSIKVNYKLHNDQMRKVVRALFRSSNPYFCPHKRPIIINFSLETIEKTLKRK